MTVKFSVPVDVPDNIVTNYQSYITVSLIANPSLHYVWFYALSYFNSTGFGVRFTILNPMSLNMYRVRLVLDILVFRSKNKLVSKSITYMIFQLLMSLLSLRPTF